MLRVELLYKLHPPSVFGLPGDEYTVVRGGEGGTKEVIGPTIDRRAGAVVSPGTLSQYRNLDEQLSLRIQHGDVDVRLLDNYLCNDGSRRRAPNASYRAL